MRQIPVSFYVISKKKGGKKRERERERVGHQSAGRARASRATRKNAQRLIRARPSDEPAPSEAASAPGSAHHVADAT